jgi:hypothetical protein
MNLGGRKSLGRTWRPLLVFCISVWMRRRHRSGGAAAILLMMVLGCWPRRQTPNSVLGDWIRAWNSQVSHSRDVFSCRRVHKIRAGDGRAGHHGPHSETLELRAFRVACGNYLVVTALLMIPGNPLSSALGSLASVNNLIVFRVLR